MTTTFPCPKGHASTEADYCSECGARILPHSQSEDTVIQDVSPANNTKTKLEICPECTTPHEPNSGKFCEICGYNFLTGAQGELPMLSTVLPPTPEILPLENTLQGKTQDKSENQPKLDNSQSRWQVLVRVDPIPHDPLSPPSPTNQPEIAIQLNKPVNLIGRTSKVRAIFPEIPLDFDDAVSSRHALLICQLDGTLLLRDIGSSNGTLLKGIELKPMTDIPLEDGDEFTLGHWSRILIKRSSGEK